MTLIVLAVLVLVGFVYLLRIAISIVRITGETEGLRDLAVVVTAFMWGRKSLGSAQSPAADS